MDNILTKGSKISVVFTILALFIVSVVGQPGSGNIKLRRAVDTDNDGKADISVFRPSDNTWYILSNGNVRIQQFGVSNEDRVAPGDFDGDGKGDISVWRDSTGIWFRLNSSDNTFVVYQFGAFGDEPVARDYNGDGKTDFATVRRSNGSMFWYIGNDLGGYSITNWGVATDYIAPGDFDGDGKFDIAVQRPGTIASGAIFMIIRSSDNTLQGFQWGQPNDLFAPGDYDGDGKTDLAVVREGATPDSPLVWYILQMNGQVRIQQYGVSGIDIIIQNDYDGDGKTDFAVWRITDGTFIILRSSDNRFEGYQWGGGNDIPIASHDTH